MSWTCRAIPQPDPANVIPHRGGDRSTEDHRLRAVVATDWPVGGPGRLGMSRAPPRSATSPSPGPRWPTTTPGARFHTRTLATMASSSVGSKSASMRIGRLPKLGATARRRSPARVTDLVGRQFTPGGCRPDAGARYSTVAGCLPGRCDPPRQPRPRAPCRPSAPCSTAQRRWAGQQQNATRPRRSTSILGGTSGSTRPR